MVAHVMSMAPKIMKHDLHLKIAREIWSGLAKEFYDGTDDVQVFFLYEKAFSTK